MTTHDPIIHPSGRTTDGNRELNLGMAPGPNHWSARPAPSHAKSNSTVPDQSAVASRLDHLDATRAFALLLGVGFHASISFTPTFMGWAVQDISTSTLVTYFILVSHTFRMELFFLLAGFFGHGLLQRRGSGNFLLSRAVRLGGPMVVGWFLLRPLLVSGWIMGAASLRGDYHFWPGIRDGFASLSHLPAGLFTGSHLWFLYYLLVVTGLVFAVRVTVQNGVRLLAGNEMLTTLYSRLDAITAWLAHSSWGLPLLLLPTAAALWWMHGWSVDTPDQSLSPNFPVLAIYSGCFVLGWAFARQPAAFKAFGRITRSRALLLAAGLGATLWLSSIEGDPAHPHFKAAHAGFALGYAILMWTMVMLTLDVFHRLCSRPNAAIRYLADSSYWIYLVHLPVVVWLQVAVAELPFHWALKWAMVTVATVAIALLTYDLFVRSTLLGQMLNGRRRDRVLRLN